MEVLSADRAASLIHDDWTLTVGGFGHCGAPESLLAALERRFLTTGTPRRLSLMFASGAGDKSGKGVDRLAHPGLLTRIVGGFWSLAPKIGQMVAANAIEAHNWPQGVVSHMFRAIAAGQPGLVTEVGLGTFIDPRQEGGRLNACTSERLVEPMQVGGKDAILYRATPLQCALLRGSRADERGNISMEREANLQDVLAQAQAVRNSGGIVIVQVMSVCKAGSIPPQHVKIPGALVDYVVVADCNEHRQTYGEHYNPAYTGDWGQAACDHARSAEATAPDTPAVKRIIARRALLELLELSNREQRRRPLLVNLGIGTPEEVAAEARRQDRGKHRGFTLAVESGAIGGTPAGGLSFGATEYPEALLGQAENFDFYDGGGIDLSFLGFGEIDSGGRINVASLGNRLNGVGGFVNISQAAQRLVFCGAFTAGGLQVESDACNGLRITTEGSVRKLVSAVGRICYDPAGRARCKDPLVVTERAVMRLTAAGLEVVEIAPGIDLQRDVLSLADFELRVSPALKLMPATTFSTGGLTVPYEN